jgi:hypothetical protein
MFTLLISLFFVACGKDGEDGDAFIAITWVYGPFDYWTDDPAIPSIFYNNKYYQCYPGNYNYTYWAWDDSIWSGSYRIYINEGEEAKGFKDGEDGADIYFLLQAYSIGPLFTIWDYPYYTFGEDFEILSTDISEENLIDNNNPELLKKMEEDKYRALGFDESQIGISAVNHGLDDDNFFQLNIEEHDFVVKEGQLGRYGYIFKYTQIK